MAHADRDGKLQLMRNQQPGYFQRMITLTLWAWPRLLLRWFITTSMRCIQILMTGRIPLGEAIADHLVSIIARPLVLLWTKGTKYWKLKSSCHPGSRAIPLLILSLRLQITAAACANQLQNESDSQSRCGAPNVQTTHELKAVVWTILAAMTTIGVTIAGGMYYLRSLVPTTEAPVAVIQANPPAIQANPPANPPAIRANPPAIQANPPAIQALPPAIQALPVIPVVEGDDFDDVLARAPIPTKPTSPLSWL